MSAKLTKPTLPLEVINPETSAAEEKSRESLSEVARLYRRLQKIIKKLDDTETKENADIEETLLNKKLIFQQKNRKIAELNKICWDENHQNKKISYQELHYDVEDDLFNTEEQISLEITPKGETNVDFKEVHLNDKLGNGSKEDISETIDSSQKLEPPICRDIQNVFEEHLTDNNTIAHDVELSSISMKESASETTTIDSDTIKDHFSSIQELCKQSKYPEAIDKVNKIIGQSDGSNASNDFKHVKDAYMCLGCIFLIQGKFREGTEAIAKAFPTYKTNKRAGNTGKIEGPGGIKIMIPVDSSTLPRKILHGKRGHYFLQAGFIEDALEEYQKVFEYDSEGCLENWNIAKTMIILDNIKGNISDETVEKVKRAYEKVPFYIKGLSRGIVLPPQSK